MSLDFQRCLLICLGDLVGDLEALAWVISRLIKRSAFVTASRGASSVELPLFPLCRNTQHAHTMQHVPHTQLTKQWRARGANKRTYCHSATMTIIHNTGIYKKRPTMAGLNYSRLRIPPQSRLSRQLSSAQQSKLVGPKCSSLRTRHHRRHRRRRRRHPRHRHHPPFQMQQH